MRELFLSEPVKCRKFIFCWWNYSRAETTCGNTVYKLVYKKFVNSWFPKSQILFRKRLQDFIRRTYKHCFCYCNFTFWPLRELTYLLRFLILLMQAQYCKRLGIWLWGFVRIRNSFIRHKFPISHLVNHRSLKSNQTL